MLRWILLLFVIVPLVELSLLLWISTKITLLPTIALVVFTGSLGGYLAKREGLRVYREWNRALSAMQAPEVGIIDGLLVLVGGAFLITPGILTDLAGLCLLLPPTRRFIARRIRNELQRRLDAGQGPLFFSSFGGGEPWPESTPRDSTTVTTTGEVVEPSEVGNDTGSQRPRLGDPRR